MAQRQQQTPGELIRELLKERNWTQEDLALIVGRSVRMIGEIIRGKSGITPEAAFSLAAAFGNTPEEWLLLDTSYKLSLLSIDTSDIERRAALFSRGPILEMQRRGWLRPTDDLDELDAELDHFFGGADEGNVLSVAARRSATIPYLTPAEAAWYFRAKKLAGTLLVSPFATERMGKLKSELRRLAAHPKEARHLAKLMADFGIRFVVVEPLSGIRVDGAALWDEVGPIIAVSLRYDRVDGFWFTVMHEFSHIRNEDPSSVDSEMVDAERGILLRLTQNENEERADREASDALIPAKELESFIGRVGPLYPKDRVIQFANRIRIHPGIIVGQLQHRGEIGYWAMREQLAKIRDIVTSTALTDGWGHTISPSIARRLT